MFSAAGAVSTRPATSVSTYALIDCWLAAAVALLVAILSSSRRVSWVLVSVSAAHSNIVPLDGTFNTCPEEPIVFGSLNTTAPSLCISTFPLPSVSNAIYELGSVYATVIFECEVAELFLKIKS